MTLSTGRGLRWLIWQAELGRRTEASQIIHKHNGHQFWIDDRWADLQRPGFNFYSLFHFFHSARDCIAFTKSFVSLKASEKKPSSSKGEPRAVVPAQQMTKWIKHAAIIAVIWIMTPSSCLVGIAMETRCYLCNEYHTANHKVSDFLFCFVLQLETSQIVCLSPTEI